MICLWRKMPDLYAAIEIMYIFISVSKLCNESRKGSGMVTELCILYVVWKTCSE